ncbi:hypothetical protein [Wolbachia endosymbiont (group A) of Ennomos erosarius]|uniref:hypothetical protein n=1 Tax=Wolbachia endosymbiont (group A) of Ennomos erosarius TaxID=3066174 RepID=UPI00397A9ACC
MNIAICRQFAWQMKVADTGIQPLLCSHLVEIKSSGSQCLGTGMTPLGTAVIKEPVSATCMTSVRLTVQLESCI